MATKEFIEAFSEFGVVSKLFISSEKGYGKVYMRNKQDADIAFERLSANNKLQLTVYPPCSAIEAQRDYYKMQRKEMPANNTYRDEEFDAVTGDDMYDIYNNKVTPLIGENGEAYIPLKSIEKSGYKLYTSKRTDDASDEQSLEKFRSFLMTQANIFLNLSKSHISERVVKDSIEKTIASVNGSPGLTNGISIKRNVHNDIASKSDVACSQPSYAAKSPQGHLRRPHENKTTSSFPTIDRVQYKNAELEAKPNKVKIQRVLKYDNATYRVLLCKNSDLIDQILVDTHTEANQHINVTEPELNQICAVKNYAKHDIWDRACIYSVNPLAVIFIDSGNVWAFPNEEPDLRVLSPALCSIPAQSIRIALSGAVRYADIQEGSIIDVYPIKQYSSGTYVVDNLTSQNVTPQRAEQPTVRTSPKPTMSNLEYTPTRKQHDSPSVRSTPEQPKPVMLAAGCDLSTRSKAQTEESLKTESNRLSGASKMAAMREKLANTRKSVTAVPTALTYDPTRECMVDTDLLLGTGMLYSIEKIDEESFIAALYTENGTEINDQAEGVHASVKYDPNFVAKVGDTVAAEHLDEADETVKWTRCFVLDKQGSEYTIAVIDFGVIKKTNKITELQEKFKKVAEFVAVCLCDKKYMHLIQEKECYSINSKERNKAIVTLEEGVKVDLIFKRWIPVLDNKPALGTNTKPLKVEQEVITQLPVPKTNIKPNDMAMLINEHDGLLYLRTKDTSAVIKQLIITISNCDLKPLDRPAIPNQLVLRKHDNEIRRAQVIAISGDNATLQYFDYGVLAEAPLNTLCYIEPRFSRIEATLYSVHLKGYETGGFSENVKKYLKKCFKLQKFVVTSATGNIVELNVDGTNLDSVLKEVDKPLYKKLSDLDIVQLPIGKSMNLLLMNTDRLNESIVSFYLLNPDTESFLEMQDLLVVYTDAEIPLNLHEGELCVTKYEDDFYRAAVVKYDDILDKYLVYFIDFGNNSYVALEDIRVIKDDIATRVPVAIECRIKALWDATNGLISDDSVKLLENHVGAATSCNVTVLSLNDRIYDITFPKMEDKARELNLI